MSVFLSLKMVSLPILLSPNVFVTSPLPRISAIFARSLGFVLIFVDSYLISQQKVNPFGPFKRKALRLSGRINVKKRLGKSKTI